MEALKPCPFCGSAAVSFEPDESQAIEGITTGFIWCDGCYFATDSYDQKIITKKWNRRANNE